MDVLVNASVVWLDLLIFPELAKSPQDLGNIDDLGSLGNQLIRWEDESNGSTNPRCGAVGSD